MDAKQRGGEHGGGVRGLGGSARFHGICPAAGGDPAHDRPTLTGICNVSVL